MEKGPRGGRHKGGLPRGELRKSGARAIACLERCCRRGLVTLNWHSVYTSFTFHDGNQKRTRWINPMSVPDAYRPLATRQNI